MGDLDKGLEDSIKDPALREIYRATSDALAEKVNEALAEWASNPEEMLNKLLDLDMSLVPLPCQDQSLERDANCFLLSLLLSIGLMELTFNSETHSV